MSRGRLRSAILGLCWLGLSAAAQAQPAGDAEAREALERFLREHGLTALLAEHLEAVHEDSGGQARQDVARRLSAVYAELIEAAPDPRARGAWEARARKLLAQLSGPDALELRLSLARSAYGAMENDAERHRLRLLSAEQVAASAEALGALHAELALIYGEYDRRLETLDRQDDGTKGAAFVAEVAEARRGRAAAAYFAAWSAHDLGVLESSDHRALEALRFFGVVLGRPRPAAPDVSAVRGESLRVEFVARAALGAALAFAQRGADREALELLRLLEGEPGVIPGLRATLPARRIALLGARKRWDEVEAVVAQLRGRGPAGPGPSADRLLEPAVARLLAVVTLEAADTRDPVQAKLARLAVEDLAAQGQTAQVLDLASRYGAALLGQTGFLPLYARGVRAFESAAAALARAGGPDDQPARAPEVVNAFNESAALLASALAQADAARFAPADARAASLAGRCLFFAGRFVDASGAFARASALGERALGPGWAQDQLWLAVVSVDAGLRDGGGSATARVAMNIELLKVGTLFVRSFPQSPRAATVLVRLGDRAGIDDEQAVSVLGAVPAQDPAYERAQRELARLLYKRYRAADRAGGAFAAERFAVVAERLIGIERAVALGPDEAQARAAAERVIVLARQVLDAALSLAPPDVPRARAALEAAERVAAFNRLSVQEHAGELAFRRVQILMAEGRQDEAAALAKAQSDPRWAELLDRVFYNRAAERLAALTEPGQARQVALGDLVAFGLRVIERAGEPARALRDPAIATVYQGVAGAALELWQLAGNTGARDTALRLDRQLLTLGPSAGSLRRLALLEESVGNLAEARARWEQLLAGLPPGGAAWFEARYESLRLLAQSDPALAAQAIAQVRVLYPDLGPPPWNSKLAELAQRLGVPSPQAGVARGNGPAGVRGAR
ncbi:MAG: hypothetical protein C0513_03395 [Isosphaera sp.]|nr:hypothetical protein [Isosphaera sp.]